MTRTRETLLTPTRFPGVRLQPLGYPTVRHDDDPGSPVLDCKMGRDGDFAVDAGYNAREPGTGAAVGGRSVWTWAKILGSRS